MFNEAEFLSGEPYLQYRLSIEGASESLIDRALQEARIGDLYLGDALDKLSPLAPATGASANEIQASIPAVDLELGELGSEPAAEIKFVEIDDFWRTPQAELLLGGRRIALAAFVPEAFVMVIPPASMVVDITYRPENRSGEAVDDWPPRVADEEFPHDGSLILWRHYVGSHSASMDGFSARGRFGQVRRILLNPVEGVTLLVGRALSVRAKRRERVRNDPSWRLRRWWKERRAPAIARTPSMESVNLSEVADGAAVVTIHGTMSCGVRLASEIRNAIVASNPGRIWPVLRFEHDTWLSVSDNALDLLNQVQRLKLQRVLLVAHSRGGLVGAETLERAPTSLSSAELISLGTPFAGTPVADVAAEAFSPAFTVMDQMEIDALTRWFGFLYIGRIPDGIADMQTRSGYIRASSFRPLSNAIGAGGAVDFHSSIRQCGLSWIWRSAMRGLAQGVIADGDNDLVVPRLSALARVAQRIDLTCDHFCYLDEVDVRDAIVAGHLRL
ncbi:hypothetical protein [Actinoplanes sp. NPDC020271]|uniref:hypothetical protein n=1 Tax=Actinoplanes sp. NPDC020271 TaxID=3363896 RepID=UPI003799744F